MKRFKNGKRVTKATNAIDPATTTGKTWGFKPIPGKGGATTNHDFEMEDKECKKIIHR